MGAPVRIDVGVEGRSSAFGFEMFDALIFAHKCMFYRLWEVLIEMNINICKAASPEKMVERKKSITMEQLFGAYKC